jgi:hypothetical protein
MAKVKGDRGKKYRTCLACGNPFYPDPGHECMLNLEYLMEQLYGKEWRTPFP